MKRGDCDSVRKTALVRWMRNPRMTVPTLGTIVAGLIVAVAPPPGAAVGQQKGKPDAAATRTRLEKAGGPANAATKSDADDADDERPKKVVKSDSEWMKILSREQYRVTRKKQTERPFTGNLWKNKKDGVYVCVCCGQPLFDSKAKFDAKNGYPCFNTVIDEKAITVAGDKKRIECSRCDANLGQIIASSAPVGGAPPVGAPPQPPPGVAQPPAGAQLPGIGPPPAVAQPAVQAKYCLNNQSIKFISRDDFEKMRKKSK